MPLNLNDEEQTPALLEIEASLLPPLRRVFFLRRPSTFLVQLQQNRFLHNWRKVSPGDEYPRFARAFPNFLDQWRRFIEFLQENKFGQPKLEAFELNYFNQITGENAQFPRDVWNFLSFYEKNPNAALPTPASAMNIRFVWPLERDGEKLFLAIKHGTRISDQKSVLLMELTVRGRLQAGDDEQELISRFANAHDMIVQSFLKLTTQEAHKHWGVRA